MVQQYKKYSLISGLIYTVLAALFCFAFTWIIFTDDIFVRMKEYLFDCGIDVMTKRYYYIWPRGININIDIETEIIEF